MIHSREHDSFDGDKMHWHFHGTIYSRKRIENAETSSERAITQMAFWIWNWAIERTAELWTCSGVNKVQDRILGSMDVKSGKGHRMGCRGVCLYYWWCRGTTCDKLERISRAVIFNVISIESKVKEYVTWLNNYLKYMACNWIFMSRAKTLVTQCKDHWQESWSMLSLNHVFRSSMTTDKDLVCTI